MLSDKFLAIAIIGIDPVLWILIAMSVLSIGVIVERALAFGYLEKNLQKLSEPQLRLALEERLGVLATFGNNAPFIGLFGTVLGVIQAFHKLGQNNEFVINSVMSGISEALVATAMGLFVAIPCVVAYNYFVRRTRRILILREIESGESK